MAFSAPFNDPGFDSFPFRVLFEDEHYIAVDKPAGLLVHPSTLVHGMPRHRQLNCMRLLRDRLGHRVYPVHRLDRPTSGVLLVAKTPEAASAAGKLMCGREVRKRYAAIVRGYVPDSGVIDSPIAGNPARTIYRRLRQVELPFPVGRYPTSRYSLLDLEIETGRRHQIRLHLHHISHPVIGDTWHGDGRHNRFFRERFGIHRLMLTARELSLAHPMTGQGLTVRADWPTAFSALFVEFGWAELS